MRQEDTIRYCTRVSRGRNKEPARHVWRGKGIALHRFALLRISPMRALMKEGVETREHHASGIVPCMFDVFCLVPEESMRQAVSRVFRQRA